MFKKLLSLAAIAAVSLGANAAQGDVIVDYEIDYSTYDSFPFYVMGYTPYFADGCMVSENPMEETDDDGNAAPSWYQYFVADGIPTTPGLNYKVTVCAKASEEVSFNLNMGWGWGDGEQIGMQLELTTDFEEHEITYAEVGGASCNLVAQPGGSTAKIEWKWIKVSHVDNAKPVEWVELLENGDAEGEYGEVPCAYSKEYKGRNSDGSETASPEPCAIEDGVFVVHAKAVDPQAYPNVFLEDDGSVKGDPQWQNQFWIQSPKAWKTGDIIRISFKYKAEKAASADTQAHKQTPGDYLHWQLLGSINFTTEWQDFSKEVTVSADQNGMWSAAFNLKDYTMDNTYYFDDLKWETMKLDEGWFIAGDFNGWNLDGALEMPWDEENSAYGIVVGTEENPASSVKISTVRGNDNAFNGATIKPKGDLLDGEDWVEYAVSSAAKIALPEPGYWYIGVDPENMQIGIMKSDEPAGFTDVISDNAAPVYYNLQGMQVKNPEAGKVYIVKRGSKVSKIYIR